MGFGQYSYEPKVSKPDFAGRRTETGKKRLRHVFDNPAHVWATPRKTAADTSKTTPGSQVVTGISKLPLMGLALSFLIVIHTPLLPASNWDGRQFFFSALVNRTASRPAAT